MRDIMKLGLRLFLITIIAALCLAGTNMLTHEAIANANRNAIEASRKQALPGADAFEPLDIATYIAADDKTYATLSEISRGTANGETIGYVLLLNPNGYKAEIPITVGIDDKTGEIMGIAIGDIQETAGLGTKVKESKFMGQFAGMPAQGEAVAQLAQTISGATVSSRACVEAVTLAAQFYETYLNTQKRAGPVMYEDVTLPEIGVGEYEAIQSIQRAMQGGNAIGYRFTLAPQGFGGKIPILLTIDARTDTVKSIEIGDVQETDGIGTKILEQEFLGQFPGLSANADTVQGVQTISGATVSSRACVQAVKLAVQFYEKLLKAQADPNAATPDATSSATPTTPDPATYEEVDLAGKIGVGEYDAIQSVQRAVVDGQTVGYRFQLAPMSFQAVIPITVMIDARTHTIQSIEIGEIHEGEGYGTKILEPSFLGQFTGVAAKAGAVTQDVQTISGATGSSSTCVKAVEQAVACYDALLRGGEGQP